MPQPPCQIPAPVLRRLLAATVRVVPPRPDLPAPVNMAYLGLSANGTWTATSTDGCTLATASLRPSPTAPTAPTAPPATPTSWLLDAALAITFLDTLPEHASDDVLLPLTVARPCPTQTYPDWRTLTPSLEVAALHGFQVSPTTIRSALSTRHGDVVDLQFLPLSPFGDPAGQSPAAAPQAPPTPGVLPGDGTSPPVQVAALPTPLSTPLTAPLHLGRYDHSRLLAILDATADAPGLTLIPFQKPAGPLPHRPLAIIAAGLLATETRQYLLAPCL